MISKSSLTSGNNLAKTLSSSNTTSVSPKNLDPSKAVEATYQLFKEHVPREGKRH